MNITDLRVCVVTDPVCAGSGVWWTPSWRPSPGERPPFSSGTREPPMELLEQAKQLLEVLKPLDIPLVVNDRVHVARLAGAQGIHVGREDMPVQEVRARVGQEMWIGFSVETPEAALSFLPVVNYAGVGPVFSTGTKPDALPGGAGRTAATGVCLAGSSHRDRRNPPRECGELVGNGCEGNGGGLCRVWSTRSTKGHTGLADGNGGRMRFANVLSIAGSDPSGGAGIQADLKTFSALGTYGMSVLTALTAQSTRGVTGVVALEPEFVVAQLETLHEDVAIHGIKVGMVANAGLPPLWPMSSTETHGTLQSCSTRDGRERGALARSGCIGSCSASTGAPCHRGDPEPSGSRRPVEHREATTVRNGSKRADYSSWSTGGDAQRGSSCGRGESGPVAHRGWSTMARGEPGSNLQYPRNRMHRPRPLRSAGSGIPLPEVAAQAKAYVTEAIQQSNQLTGNRHGPVHHFHALWGNQSPNDTKLENQIC